MFPEGAKMHAKLNLPVLKFKRNKVEYTVTDLRPLNEKAISVFEMMLEAIAEDPEIREITFDATGVEENTIDLIEDIITAMEVTARKKGKNGYEISGYLIASGTRGEEQQGKRTVTYELIADNVKPIYEIVKEKGHVSMPEIAVAVADRMIESFGS